MRKYIGYSLFLAVCLFLADLGEAQILSTSTRGAIADSITGWPNRAKVWESNMPLSILSADIPLGYFNSSIPSLGFGAPIQIGSYIVPTYGERITMPGSGGFLDSVQITIDSITGDSIDVYMIADTLYSTGAGTFHLMNIFDQNAQSFDVGYVHAAQVHGRSVVTLPVPHTEIPAQNFWIAVEPNFDAVSRNFTNGYLVTGDSEEIVPRTTDNCRSGFLALLNTGQTLSAVLDSTFLSTTGVPLYSNFYITAFVSSQASGVSGSSAPGTISVFPDPASTFVNIQGTEGLATIELLDLLGRPVLSAQFDGEGKLDVGRIQVGRYQAVIHTTNRLITMPLVIQR